MPRRIIPYNSVFLIFSLKIIIEIKTENINSVCPTALTSAAVARPKATNQPKAKQLFVTQLSFTVPTVQNEHKENSVTLLETYQRGWTRGAGQD